MKAFLQYCGWVLAFGIAGGVSVYSLQKVANLVIASLYRKKHEEEKVKQWEGRVTQWARRAAFWVWAFSTFLIAPYKYHTSHIIASPHNPDYDETTNHLNEARGKLAAAEIHMRADSNRFAQINQTLLSISNQLAAYQVEHMRPPSAYLKDLYSKIKAVQSNIVVKDIEAEVAKRQQNAEFDAAIRRAEVAESVRSTVEPMYPYWLYAIEQFEDMMAGVVNKTQVVDRIEVPSLEYISDKAPFQKHVKVGDQWSATVEFNKEVLFIAPHGEGVRNGYVALGRDGPKLSAKYEIRFVNADGIIVDGVAPFASHDECVSNIQVALRLLIQDQAPHFRQKQ